MSNKTKLRVYNESLKIEIYKTSTYIISKQFFKQKNFFLIPDNVLNNKKHIKKFYEKKTFLRKNKFKKII